jgi:hypothetical protein
MSISYHAGIPPKYPMRNFIDIIESNSPLTESRSDLPFDEREVLSYIITKFEIYRPDTENLEEVARAKMYSVYDNIKEHFNGWTIKIYREITAPEDWAPDENARFGVYWTWDEHSAYAYNGKRNEGHVKWLITANADEDQIDWNTTIVANANPAFEMEREITLKERAYVDVISIDRVY